MHGFLCKNYGDSSVESCQKILFNEEKLIDNNIDNTENYKKCVNMYFTNENINFNFLS